ncbi:phage protein Gp36 family protein [Litoribacter populi]|uniref:phage protein Gp36 family protein n=1 Tax=Litoribacter populi TaxID=2598460 RepID=UPI001180C729|nr:phage protein Gp36 family protein [Litoribacter populi]
MLLKEDFNTHLYDELIQAISREDDAKLDKAIQAAEGQAKGYLSRFDIDALFSTEGEDRDEMLLMHLKDLAVWHFITIANPNINIQLAKERFDDAIKELGKIQAGKVVPYNWPTATNPESNGFLFHFKSKPKRETSY